MTNRAALVALLITVAGLKPVQADIFRWDNGELIPGTKGVILAPEAQLSDWNSESRNLRFADFSHQNLQSSQFSRSWLDHARFIGVDLTNANLSGANLAHTDFSHARLMNAQFVGANGQTGFGIPSFMNADLTNANLTNADFRGADFTNADLSRANLTGAKLSFGPTFTGASLSDAIVAGADLSANPWIGTTISSEQLYSTRSYQEKNLRGLGLQCADLTGWDFTGQDLTAARLHSTGDGACATNLTSANFAEAILSDANLSQTSVTKSIFDRAIVTGTDFSGAGYMFGDSLGGLTEEQLYSTASYETKNLQMVRFSHSDLNDWDFSGQNLTNAALNSTVLAGADLGSSTITGADLSGANLSEANLWYATVTDADLTGAVVTAASLHGVTFGGFSKEQLYSTASYQSKDLRGIILGSEVPFEGSQGNDLTGWDFTGQDLSSAGLGFSVLTDVNLTGANLKGALLDGMDTLDTVSFDSATVYNQWTVFPSGFNPIDSGLTLMPSSDGDFDFNNSVDAADVDLLVERIRFRFKPVTTELVRYKSWLDTMFDVNGDSSINEQDQRTWVKVIKNTWFGDANLDGEFNSADLVDIFKAGEYEDAIEDNSGWAEGDWNADGDFTSGDLVAAFTDGGYEQGPRVPANAVPEPTSLFMLVTALIGIAFRRRLAVH